MENLENGFFVRIARKKRLKDMLAIYEKRIENCTSFEELEDLLDDAEDSFDADYFE